MDTNAFAKMMPGFDFLQTLMESAGHAVPTMGQWIAPTLNPEELEKRIGELKTVQFWLEQNARMISTTIQALEVQRMTLSTLQTMNLPMADLRSALTLPTIPEPAPAAPKAHAPAISPAPAEKAPRASGTSASGAATAALPAGVPGGVDPMQWWGALTQQFTELATKAMHDSSAIAARNLATTAPATKAPSTAAKSATKKKAPTKAARKRA